MRFSSNRQDPFAPLPWTFVVVRYWLLLSAPASVYLGFPTNRAAYTASHDRMDSPFFGALLGYLYHFRPHILNNLLHVHEESDFHLGLLCWLAFNDLLPFRDVGFSLRSVTRGFILD